MVCAHRRIALAALLLSACFVDPGKAGTVGDDTTTGTTAAATTGPSATTTGTSTSAPTTGPDAASSSGAPTTGPVCETYGQPCGATPCCGCLTCEDGTCKRQDAACEDCNVCEDDGACRSAPDGDSCDLDVDPCEQTAWGVENGTCYAALPGGGLCDGGVCKSGGCIGKGAPVFTCPKCVRNDHKCQPGATLVGLTLADLCHLEEPAPSCDAKCSNGAITYYRCDAMGACIEEGGLPGYCNGYGCSADGSTCLTSCNSSADCFVGFVCDLDTNECYAP